MCSEEVGLRVEELPCLYYLVRVQIVLFAEPGGRQLAAVVSYPVVECGDGNFGLVSSPHRS